MLAKNISHLPVIARNYCTNFLAKRATDWFLAIFFMALGGSIALTFYQKIGYTFFYQNFLPEAILWACGNDFLFPKHTITELIPFLKGQVLSFDCKSLPHLDLYDRASDFAGAQPYLTWIVAFLWKWLGVNYHALGVIIFVLWGTYTSGIYLLFRQFCTKWIAVLATLFICFSPVMAHMIGSLRDFSKAPFIIWAIFLLIYTIKQPRKTGFKAYTPPVLAGAIAGLGLGFRSDLLFLLPIGSMFLMLGYSNSNIKTLWPQIISKLKVVALFTFFFIAFAYPILKNGGAGGASGVFIMEGMSEPFRTSLKLPPGTYVTSSAYSDELTLSSIGASEREKNTEKWDQNELASIPGISVSQTIRLGTENLSRWADIFVGDYASQGIKSAAWIIGFPLYIANSHNQLSIPTDKISPASILYDGYKKIFNILAIPILLIGFFSLLFGFFIKSKSQFFAISFLFIFLGTYPAIQFNLRHFFYLEFIWILCFISIFSLPINIRNYKNLFFHYLIYIIIASSLVAIGYLTALRYQQETLAIEVGKLMALPKKEIAIKRETPNKEFIFFTVPVPPEFRELINSSPDSMTPSMEFIGTEWDVRSAAKRYLLSIEDKTCDTKGFNILLKYKETEFTWQNMDTKIKLPYDFNTQKLFFSGFYRPTQHFYSIGIPLKIASCGVKLEMVIGQSRLPYSFIKLFAEDEKIELNFKSLGNFYRN